MEVKEFKTLKELELEYIEEVLEYYKYNYSTASKVLGITRATLYRKLGITKEGKIYNEDYSWKNKVK